MKTILGIDQSIAETGLAVTDEHRLVLHAEAVSFGKKMEYAQRRALIKTRVLALLREYHPEKIVVEQVRLFSSSRSEKQKAKLLAQGREDKHINTDVMCVHHRIIGSIIDLLHDEKLAIPCVSIGTQTWKYAILGDRLATKEMTVRYVNCKQIWKGPFTPIISDNIADAICISLAGWNTRIKQEKER